MTSIEESMTNTLNLLTKHTENIIRSLAEEHGFDAEEAIQKFMNSSASTTVTIPKGKKGKKAKKPQDPDKPKNPNKKPLNSYFRFAQDKRSEVKEQNPDMKPTDITKAIKSLWDELSDEDKKPYTDKANEEMEIYKAATAEWKKSLEE